jgi:hypothetical protein
MGALNMKAETRRSVIPAQAGIQCFTPGFRVSRCSLGMTGCREHPGGRLLMRNLLLRLIDIPLNQ